MFVITSIHPIRTKLAATFHMTRWYAIGMYSFFKVDSNFELLSATLLLWFKMLASLSIDIPNILNLNLRPIICSSHIFSDMKSLEKVLYSTVTCRLLYQIIGAQLETMMYPVCDRLIFLSDTWDSWTKAVTLTNPPIGLGASLGIASVVPLYLSQNYFSVLPVNYVGSIMVRFGLKYNVIFGFFFKKSKVCNIFCKWPSQGVAWYEDIKDTSCRISTLPSFIAYFCSPINSWYMVIQSTSNAVMT